MLTSAHAGGYSEAVSGDLSNNGLSPTFVSVSAGAKVVSGTTGNGGDIGGSILARIGTGAGALGFTGALPAGSHSVWIQEFGSGTTPYGFDFTLTPVPEPAVALRFGAGAALMALRRRPR